MGSALRCSGGSLQGSSGADPALCRAERPGGPGEAASRGRGAADAAERADPSCPLFWQGRRAETLFLNPDALPASPPLPPWVFSGRKATPGHVTACAHAKPPLWSRLARLDPEAGRTPLPVSVPRAPFPARSQQVSSAVPDLVFLLTRPTAVPVLFGGGPGAGSGGTHPASLRRRR